MIKFSPIFRQFSKWQPFWKQSKNRWKLNHKCWTLMKTWSACKTLHLYQLFVLLSTKPYGNTQKSLLASLTLVYIAELSMVFLSCSITSDKYFLYRWNRKDSLFRIKSIVIGVTELAYDPLRLSAVIDDTLTKQTYPHNYLTNDSA